MFKSIQDPVWGYLEVPEGMDKIIDTSDFQRLHGIKQLGMCYLVFPGAVHTRFQHSIGTMHLASEFGMRLKTNHPRELAAAALLHDVGHFPLSHSFESYFEKTLGKSHEDVSADIIGGNVGDGSVRDALLTIHIDPDMVIDIIHGRDENLAMESSIISGPLDADEMDYLMRDSYFTGAGNTSFSIRRLIDIIQTDGRTLYVEDKGLTSVESVLISRLLMHKSVYFHKTVRIAQKMIEMALKKFSGDPASLFRMNDYLFLEKLSQDSECREMMNRIFRRQLYKVVYSREYNEEYDPDIEREFYEQYPGLILDYIPPYSFMDRKKAKNEVNIMRKGKMIDVKEVSPLLNSIYESFNKRSLYVYGPEKSEELSEELKNFFS